MADAKFHLKLSEQAQEVLKSSLLKAEVDVRNLQRLTTECRQKLVESIGAVSSGTISIEDYGQGILNYYLKFWFRAYLAIMDECMVLRTGFVVPYWQNSFMKEHVKFIHERDDEVGLYKQDDSTPRLSCCSTDGIDYVYRKHLRDTKQMTLVLISSI